MEDNKIKKYSKDYSEGGYWAKIKRYAAKFGIKPVYISLLLFYSIPKVPIIDKAIILGSLGYFISPIDAIPDSIPVIGYIDDIGVLTLAYYRIKVNIDDETREKAKGVLKSFFGNFNESIINEL